MSSHPHVSDVPAPAAGDAFAVLPWGPEGGTVLATDLAEVTADLSVLDGPGRWVVSITFEGTAWCARFDTWNPVEEPVWAALAPQPWPGVPVDAWTSSLEQPAFSRGVEAIREAIAAGDVYQVNLTRLLEADLPPGFGDAAAAAAIGRRLAAHHWAPWGATVVLPEVGVAVSSASPELFLSRHGDRIRSSPIKGTAATAGGLSGKDRAENVMIVDLVRNDLGRVCVPGSVEVPSLLAAEAHPGLVHLVSTVEGRLRAGTSWPEIIEATFPPGSVSGAPKLAALEMIRRLEPSSRGVYCGTIGWVGDAGRSAQLNVAIRTFWASHGKLRYGTGGAITHDSNPEGEWTETELKANKLLQLIARSSGRCGSTASCSTPTTP